MQKNGTSNNDSIQGGYLYCRVSRPGGSGTDNVGRFHPRDQTSGTLEQEKKSLNNSSLQW